MLILPYVSHQNYKVLTLGVHLGFLTFAAPLNDFDVFFKKSLKKPSGKAKKKCL